MRVNPLLLRRQGAAARGPAQPGHQRAWDEAAQEIVLKHYVNLGIAAATPRGLIVPNIKDADGLTLPELARGAGRADGHRPRGPDAARPPCRAARSRSPTSASSASTPAPRSSTRASPRSSRSARSARSRGSHKGKVEHPAQVTHAGAHLRPPAGRRRAGLPVPGRRRGDPGATRPAPSSGAEPVAAEGPEPTGVVFPEVDGRRSTGATGRGRRRRRAAPGRPGRRRGGRAARPTGAAATWPTSAAWSRPGWPGPRPRVAIADAGLASLHDRMRWRDPDGEQVPLGRPSAASPAARPTRCAPRPSRGGGEPRRDLALPYRGERLARRRPAPPARRLGRRRRHRADLRRGGAHVIAHPDWLRLAGPHRRRARRRRRDGPAALAAALGRRRVAAVDLPRPDLWSALLDDARGRGGPAARAGRDRGAAGDLARAGRRRPAARPAARRRLGLRPAGAARARQLRLRRRRHQRAGLAPPSTPSPRRCAGARPDTALAFLATPTDVFAVPGEAVAASVQALRRPPHVQGAARPAAHPVRRPAAAPQLRARRRPRHQRQPRAAAGPQLRRWPSGCSAGGPRRRGPRARRCRSTSPRPPAPARCVKNRALAAAYAGAHRFGIEVFEPATSNTLMAALLVHDLRTGAPRAASTRGRTRRTPPRTAGCGGPPTPRAARWASPPCSAWPRPAPDPGCPSSLVAPPSWVGCSGLVARATTSAPNSGRGAGSGARRCHITTETVVGEPVVHPS